MKLLFWLCVALIIDSAISDNNGVEGEPEVECGNSSITVNFNTRAPFEGHVYVKGQYDQAGCRNDEGGRQVAGITVPFDSCNTTKTKSLDPRGISISNTVVIQFHAQFETTDDRAYQIQCFYREADQNVSTQIEVSDLTTELVTQILDDNGCALDPSILNNLEYQTDLIAGQNATVYKFADRSQLFYQCKISVTIKDPESTCARPQCSEPQGSAAVKQDGNIGGGSGGGKATRGALASAQTVKAAAAPIVKTSTGATKARLLRLKRQANTMEHLLDVRAELTILDFII